MDGDTLAKLVTWVGLPALGGLCWWINQLRVDLKEAKVDIYRRLERLDTGLSAHRVESQRVFSDNTHIVRTLDELKEEIHGMRTEFNSLLRSNFFKKGE